MATRMKRLGLPPTPIKGGLYVGGDQRNAPYTDWSTFNRRAHGAQHGSNRYRGEYIRVAVSFVTFLSIFPCISSGHQSFVD